jgi:DNA polymerase III epsilon subunit-like protein
LNIFEEIRESFDREKFLKEVGVKTQTHKVSFFHKDFTNEEFDKSRVLILDFEHSKSHQIYEIGLIVLENKKIVESWFEEFQLELSDYYFDFDRKRMVEVSPDFNFEKQKLEPHHLQKLFSLIESSDFIIAHNFTAEMQILHKILYPNLKFNVSNLSIYNDEKVICTKRSFDNKYFKKMNIFEGFSNSKISEDFGWSVQFEDNQFVFKNHILNIGFPFSNYPKNISNVKLHNAFYDTLVTLTNYLSLKYLNK